MRTRGMGLDEGFRVIPLADGGTRFALPVRFRDGSPWGPAIAITIFGLLFIGTPGFIAWNFITRAGALGIASLVVALPIALVGVACVVFGVSAALGRCDVEVRSGRLVAISRLGPLRLRRSRPVEAIKSFELRGGAVRSNGRAVQAGERGELSTLAAALKGGIERPFPVAAMYSKQTLLRLGERLAQACDALSPERLMEQVDDRPAVVEVAQEDTRFTLPPAARPAGTGVTIERAEGVTTIRVPPGAKKTARALITMGALWEAITLVVVGTLGYQLITNPSSVQGSPWAGGAFLLLFLVVGVWIIIYGVSLSRRRVVFDIVGDTLLATRQGLRGVRSWEWRAGDLERVVAGPSGARVNNRPVPALRIEPRDGRTRMLLQARDEEELRWIAHEISAALWPRANEDAA